MGLRLLLIALFLMPLLPSIPLLPAQERRRSSHWAYQPVSRPTLPGNGADPWVRNPIDQFVLARLREEGLAPSPEASRGVLIRRVALDLTGLPPSPAELRQFLGDEAPGAYRRMVDHYLASPRYGEHWARLWLDLARYADTKGYEKDARRTMWPWRDWVIDAFNQDVPFDRFTIEQIAGDLLDEPSDDQILATAFHRNTMTNDEGGTDDEEFRVEAVADRVDTTFSVWMGTTMACARCHDHKYDPFSQADYYRAFAFLNQTADADRGDEEPRLAVVEQAHRAERATLELRRRELRAQIDAGYEEIAGTFDDWLKGVRARVASGPTSMQWGAWHLAGPYAGKTFRDAFDRVFPPEQSGAVPVPEGSWRERPDYADGAVHTDLQGNNAAHYLVRRFKSPAATRIGLSLGSDDAIKVWVNGRALLAKNVSRGAAPDQERVSADVEKGGNVILLKIVNGGGPAGFYFKPVPADVPAELDALLATASADAQTHEDHLRAWHRKLAPQLAPLQSSLREVEDAIARLPAVKVPIMRELPAGARRTTRIHERGSFLAPGDLVEPHIPELFQASGQAARSDRLGFATWLVSESNPLTARVAVNRFWEQLFGIGLVPTLEDFGVRGDPPSHPRLLDRLASSFMAQRWSVKQLLRLVVTSATYRQSSRVSEELAARDPQNRLLARGPRFRMKAEMVRDQALEVAGLLSDRLHGPSVMPAQPSGIWKVVYSSDAWKTSDGADRYRRGLYTFWRRTSPYPSMVTFDAPSREFCVARRLRTNTPLQALVTLNDPVYVEAAQALARRILRDGGTDTASRLDHAWLLCLARPPAQAEAARLSSLLQSQIEHYRTRQEAATKLATIPLGALPEGADPVELAAWTVVANVLLNLDEFLTKG